MFLSFYHMQDSYASQIKVRPWRSFRLNECVCGPYNADFDGDEMNLRRHTYLLQSAPALTILQMFHKRRKPERRLSSS